MAKYTLYDRFDIPKAIMPDNLLAERRLQVIHSYFEWWAQVVIEEFGLEKARELAVKWGRLKGINTARLYEIYLKKKGVDPTDLGTLIYETSRSGDILGEKYQAWIEDGKVTFQTTVCPTSKMFMQLGLGLECCVNQCDTFMAEAWKSMPHVAYKRTKRIDKDNLCEWEMWIKK